jgi:bifunctional hydroxylase/dehydrase
VNNKVTTLAACLRNGRHVLVTSPTRVDIDAQARGWKERLSRARFAREESTRAWMADIDAALIRPDGHLAWMATTHSDLATLSIALGRWLGPPRHH